MSRDVGGVVRCVLALGSWFVAHVALAMLAGGFGWWWLLATVVLFGYCFWEMDRLVRGI